MIIGTRVATDVIKAMRMPAIVVAVMVVHTDGSRLAITCGLGPAAVLRRVDSKRGKQQQQHGGYGELPVCSRSLNIVAADEDTTPD